MATTEAPRWTRLDHDERREQLLACARRLFSERHYGAVSTEEIAREVGVARGLVYHYFGTKRELFLEVVRSLVRVPPNPVPAELAGRDPEEVLSEAVDRWLEMVRRNSGTWLAAHGAQGFGRDPEIEAILDEGRERAADRIVAVLRPNEDPAQAPNELRALVRAYSGFAEAASLEWVQRRRLTRAQVQELLLQGLLQLFHEVLPRVERVGEDTQPKRRRTR